MADQPLIVACLRHADPQPTFDPLRGEVLRSPLAAAASLSDLAALERALRIAAAWGGTVLAVTAGPVAAESTLRGAMAVGAKALRLDWPSEYLAELAGDERPVAAAIAAAVRDRRPALVLCGDRTADRGTGALPAFLAHELGAVAGLGLVSLDVDGDELRGERRLPGGRRERLRIPRPAVCSVEAAGVRLRRASLPATVAARTATIDVETPKPARSTVRIGGPRAYRPRTHAVPAPPAGNSRERLTQLTGVLTSREPPAVVGPTDAGTAADEVLNFLRRNGYLDQT